MTTLNVVFATVEGRNAEGSNHSPISLHAVQSTQRSQTARAWASLHPGRREQDFLERRHHFQPWAEHREQSWDQSIRVRAAGEEIAES